MAQGAGRPESSHRITHPKEKNGLEITDKEIADVAFTLGWFMGEVETILKEKGFEGELLNTE